MSIVVGVRKEGRTWVAADTQSSFGSNRVPIENGGVTKLRRIGKAVVGTTGWGIYENILDDFLSEIDNDAAMNIEALDGYLSAQLLSPLSLSDKPGAEWMSPVWGGGDPFASGKQRWALYLRDRAGGGLAGFTETFWQPGRPHLVFQGNTGVFPAYRNRGLGRWLKAAMLDRVLRERPEARCVRTTNADSNAPMLRINQALGFKPHMAQTVWQMPAAALAAYLEREPAAA